MWISNCNIKDLKVFFDVVVILLEYMLLLIYCRCFKLSVIRKLWKFEFCEYVVNVKEFGMIVYYKYIINNDEFCIWCVDVRLSFLVCLSWVLLIWYDWMMMFYYVLIGFLESFMVGWKIFLFLFVGCLIFVLILWLVVVIKW